jgi:hypothetical protein
MDYDLSKEEQARGCPHCGESLHQANYPRSPVGIPLEHREYYEAPQPRFASPHPLK